MERVAGMMWAKHFKSMYEGSMYGAGLAVFAVWGYTIANARKGVVELNPKRVADTLGGSVEDVTAAIEYLTQPDPHSRHKACEGRRLVKEGEFQYVLPSWTAYQAILNEDARREYQRVKQAEYRAQKKGNVSQKYLGAEERSDAAYGRGDDAGCDRIAGEGL